MRAYIVSDELETVGRFHLVDGVLIEPVVSPLFVVLSDDVKRPNNSPDIVRGGVHLLGIVFSLKLLGFVHDRGFVGDWTFIALSMYCLCSVIIATWRLTTLV